MSKGSTQTFLLMQMTPVLLLWIPVAGFKQSRGSMLSLYVPDSDFLYRFSKTSACTILLWSEARPKVFLSTCHPWQYYQHAIAIQGSLGLILVLLLAAFFAVFLADILVLVLPQKKRLCLVSVAHSNLFMN